MNWIKENKFLFGFLVVMVLGIGVLGFFVLGAKGRSDEALATYQTRVSELNRLQRLPTFPNQKNLDKIAAQQTEVNAEVSALAGALAAQQIPVEDMTPEQFQDRLKAAVTAVRTKAAQSTPPVRLPGEKFFLGFQEYESAPPPKEAASALGRELKVIEWLCNLLIENRVAEIKRLDRAKLPEEEGRAKAQAKKPATPAPAKPGAKGAPPAKEATQPAVEKHRIDLAFIADQSRFRQVLNAIASHKGQFLIPRLVQVKSEKPQAPTRAAAPVAAEPPPEDPNIIAAAPPQPGPAATPAPVSTYIVGEEKIDVTLVLEMVDFSEEAAK